jgi:hypothetical protein
VSAAAVVDVGAVGVEAGVVLVLGEVLSVQLVALMVVEMKAAMTMTGGMGHDTLDVPFPWLPSSSPPWCSRARAATH